MTRKQVEKWMGFASGLATGFAIGFVIGGGTK